MQILTELASRCDVVNSATEWKSGQVLENLFYGNQFTSNCFNMPLVACCLDSVFFYDNSK